jgi:hypothetical protein
VEAEVIVMEVRRIIIVANQTACGAELLAAVRERMKEGPCEFTLVVPATPPHEQATWAEGKAHDIASHRLHEAVQQFRAAGITVTGVVGDASPVLAITDALNDSPHDEIILSTLPAKISRWLKMDLPHRVETRFGLPVTTVIGEPVGAAH